MEWMIQLIHIMLKGKTSGLLNILCEQTLNVSMETEYSVLQVSSENCRPGL